MTLRSVIEAFRRDQSGNVAIIVAFVFVPMLVLAGGATDIARHEAYRVQLQDGVDRAVLAAASLTQTRGVEATVADYLKSLDFIEDVDFKYETTNAINRRQVKVTATYDMQTAFLPLIGINKIVVNATATAIDQRRNIEISLVLDISGSMLDGSPDRIDRLRPAAKGFIDAILTKENKPSTSISIVPYGGSVNPGAWMMDWLKVPRQHNYSSCVLFKPTDYGVGMIPFNQRTQMAHFTINHEGRAPHDTANADGLEWSWCPKEATSITYLTNDATALKAKIDSMKLHDGTGTAIAMNWGMLLLEPAAQSMVAQGVSKGIIPTPFANRPASFTDGTTMKIIVLMTDGLVSQQWTPNVYAYPRACNGNTGNPKCSVETPDSGQAVNEMYAVCNRAKANGVTVFTIGFDVDDTTQMRNCASSPSHFYDVDGLNIATAFQSIAAAIQRIRLTD